MDKKKIIQVSKWVWTIAIVLAGAWFIVSNGKRYGEYIQSIPVWQLVLSAVLLIAAKLILVFFSKYAVEGEGSSLPYGELFKIVAVTQLGKYIPGGVWHFVGRFNAYYAQNMTAKKSTRVLIRENTWLLAGAAFFSLLLGGLISRAASHMSQIGITLTPVLKVGWFILIAAIWMGAMILFEWLFGGKKPIQWKTLLGLMIVQFASWVCLGLSYSSLFPLTSIDATLTTTTAYVLSWTLGYVAIFAPGGIGVREAALAWILSGMMKPDEILIYSTIHRFLYFIVELGLGLVAAILARAGCKWREGADVADMQEQHPHPSE